MSKKVAILLGSESDLKYVCDTCTLLFICFKKVKQFHYVKMFNFFLLLFSAKMTKSLKNSDNRGQKL